MKTGTVITIWIATFLVVFNSCSGEVDKKNKLKNEKVVTVEIKVQKELITFLAEDSLTITGDLYTHKGVEDNPFIILFHQAGYSRGEYIETVGKFIEMGYNCLAVDLRAGNEVNGIINETHKEAVAKGLSTEYIDAMPDMMTAIDYVKENFEYEELLILGSSYSASLALIVAAQNPGLVDGVLAFSPGEYFKYDETTIEEYASEILVPVFITSSREERKKWKAIYEALPDDAKRKYIPEDEGIHGSRALWKTTEGNQKYWKAVEKFIKKVE
jgi:dienelactone hydrolase